MLLAVAGCAHFEPRPIEVTKTASDFDQRRLDGIVAHWKWGVTNAFMEGLNSVFSATKRKARGYRSTKHLITMLYTVAAKLRLPQF